MSTPSTTVVPVQSSSSQSVQIPAWLTTAGEGAVQQATDLANKPYTPYSGDLVAPLSANQQKASTVAAQGADTGKALIDAGTSSLTKAASQASKSVGTGAPALNKAGQLYGSAGEYATNSAGSGGYGSALAHLGADAEAALAAGNASAGSQNMDALNGILGASDDYAAGSMDAGKDSIAAGAGGDLNAARGYTSGFASSIAPEDIERYFNPYVTQALDPAAESIRSEGERQRIAIGNAAGMRGAFGGSRQGVLEASNASSTQKNIGNLYKEGYATAWDKAASMAGDERGRMGGAAQLSQGTAGLSGELGTRESSRSTEALDRLLATGEAHRGAAGMESDLASAAGARLGAASGTAARAAGLEDSLATGSVNRMLAAGGAHSGLASSQSGLASADTDRLLSVVSPSFAAAQTQMQQLQSSLNNLITTGQIDQAQAQNMLDAQYQEFLREQADAANKLNSYISVLSGVPYGTQTTSSGTNEQVIQNPSVFGQIAGAGLGAAAVLSDPDTKEEIKPVEDEDVLVKLTRLPVSTYRYRPERRAEIDDDGRRRIGPMSDDFGRLFMDDPSAKIIPMPRAIGILFSAVKALEKRTSPTKGKKRAA